MLKLAHTSIISSVLVAEGPISASGGFGNLPAADWNGKYEQVGSGGWAGAIPTSVMIDPPDRLIGRGTVVGDSSKVMTRPLCPYPQVARYLGTGDTNAATSFVCEAPSNSR